MDDPNADRFNRSNGQFETGIAFDSELCALVIVAHPDDETLWAGGTMLLWPHWRWRVVSLCRGRDRDRRPRFFNAMTRLDSKGSIGEMDDSAGQCPLCDSHVQQTILLELEDTNCDLIITHSPFGEYTRHLRHEEVGRAVLHLWRTAKLSAKELWLFAYTDHQKAHYPRAIENAHLSVSLPEEVWQKKLAIIREVYGFAQDSWEAMTTPKTEAFWRFHWPSQALVWQRQCESQAHCGWDTTQDKDGDVNESAGDVRLSPFSGRFGHPGGSAVPGAKRAGRGRPSGTF